MNSLIADAVKKYNMLKSGDRVVVALSGGADSVSLLDNLNDIKELYNLTIYAAHVNHLLRGAEAERDENFCKILCKKYNVELFIKKVDVRALAKQQKISEELCGRNVRYRFFAELSAKLNAKIATAHTMSDNAETLIYNIARGSGINGAGGISPVRGNIVRPLIEVTRSQVEAYCQERSLEFVTDSTNLSDDYTRNKIRHSVVVPLKEINPSFEVSAMRFSQAAREAHDYIKKQARSALSSCKNNLGFDSKMLLNYDTAVIKAALSILCNEYAEFQPEYRHIELMTGILKNGGAVELSKDYTAVSKQNIFRIVNTDLLSVNSYKIEIPLKNTAEFEYLGKHYSAEYLNPDENQPIPMFRTRRNGDTFRPQKRNVTKSLRKLMNEIKIPSEIRDNLLLLALDSKVLWCEKIGFSADGELLNKKNCLSIKTDKSGGQNNAQGR